MNGKTKNRIDFSPKKGQMKSSKVLLVCVYDTIIFEISNQMVYERFQEFGPIVRILIFEKKQITKLFVQYENETSAASAKQELDGKKLCQNICKMSIYFSTLDTVDLKHQSTQGLNCENSDFDLVEYSPASNDLSSQHSNQGSSQIQTNYYTPFQPHPSNHTMHEDNAFFLPRSKTDNVDLVHHIQRTTNNIWGLGFNIEDTIKHDIDSILNEEEERSLTNMSLSSIDSPKKVPKIKVSEFQQQNLVLGFKTRQLLKPQFIYNLFSNFGNVSRILSSKSQVKIKFRTTEFAAIAKNYLNNLKFFNSALQLTPLPFESCLPDENQYSELITYDSSTDRFTQKKSITINPPSIVLHISGMKRQSNSVAEIKRMFAFISEPVKIKILKQSYEKNMALVKFTDLETSLRIVAECHNMMVGTRKIQISFTKSQI